MDPFNPVPDYLSRIRFDIALTSNTWSSSWRLSHLCAHRNPVQLSASSPHAKVLFSFFCYQGRAENGGAPRRGIFSFLLS